MWRRAVSEGHAASIIGVEKKPGGEVVRYREKRTEVGRMNEALVSHPEDGSNILFRNDMHGMLLSEAYFSFI